VGRVAAVGNLIPVGPPRLSRVRQCHHLHSQRLHCPALPRSAGDREIFELAI